MGPRRLFATILLFPILLLAACAGGTDEETDRDEAISSEAKGEVAANYADIVLAAYDASIASSGQMQAAIEAFLSAPDQAKLDAARQAWLDSRNDYLITEAYRFYDGPIDNPENGPEGKINAWPMDESYVDYVEGNPGAGIINSSEIPEITADVIVENNEKGGETNISTGWHAIEFLLWGQDLSPAGPGNRPVTDYTTSPAAARRSTYLKLVTQQLQDDLTSVRDQWAETGEYRADFLGDSDLAIQRIMRGIGALNSGELAGERITVAYESRDQEDEHSCFSDNTNKDIEGDIRGIQIVYLGEFGEAAGPGIGSLVAAVDPELDARIRTSLDVLLTKSQALPGTFESMIAGEDGTPGRQAVLDLITGLEEQGMDLSEAAKGLGVEVNFDV